MYSAESTHSFTTGEKERIFESFWAYDNCSCGDFLKNRNNIAQYSLMYCNICHEILISAQITVGLSLYKVIYFAKFQLLVKLLDDFPNDFNFLVVAQHIQGVNTRKIPIFFSESSFFFTKEWRDWSRKILWIFFPTDC